MNLRKVTAAALVMPFLLAGCGVNLTFNLMARDSGNIYTGTMNGNGAGSGTITIALDGTTCAGPVARVASNETFGFASSFGANNRGTTASSFSTVGTSGDAFVKAILSCSNGKGLRCDLTGRGSSGGGICVGEAGRVYDAVITAR